MPRYKLARWSDGTGPEPKRTLNITSDITIGPIYEKEGILSQIKGKIGEYKVIGRLLDLALDVYVPIVDVKGIDCIIRLEPGKYREVQVKTRGTQKKRQRNL